MSTPMQLQYLKLKKQYPDCVLLFRLGDFYEGFDEDATTLSKVLGITLTGRGAKDNRTPMAGIPYHSLPQYLPKLIEAGFKVAIAEQKEEAQPGKLVDRDVVKIITAGTFTDEKSLNESKNNYLASIYKYSDKKNNNWGFSLCDLTTGEFSTLQIHSQTLPVEIQSIISTKAPQEILVDKNIASEGFLKELRSTITEFEDTYLDIDDSRKILCQQFETKSLGGFGIDEYESAIVSAAAIINYLKETQKTDLKHIKSISKLNYGDHMMLDRSTILNLEIFDNGYKESVSLFSILNKCLTPMGQRLLRQYLFEPLTNSDRIRSRHDAVDEIFNDQKLLKLLEEKLSGIYDIERLLGKIGVSSANARDLRALLFSVERIIELSKIDFNFKSELLQKIFDIVINSPHLSHIQNLIENSINENPPVEINEGGMIKTGYHNELDELRRISKNVKNEIAMIQQNEIVATGISSLKIKFNSVFGYYIEISKSNIDKVPDRFIRKQTLVNAERYITQELKELEEKVLGAEDKIKSIEFDLFCQIRNEIAGYISSLQENAKVVAQLDVLVNFAKIAIENNYTKPEISADFSIYLKESRHPVVERVSNEPFIANDLSLDSKSNLMILTGPNMAGKSTFIRQIAAIALMSQIGSFVPALEAKLPVFDRIYTRVGASDNLSKGESTFMVEMNETANILNNATDRSLIILDEIGRGTSTYDGVSLAWSIVEYIQQNLKSMTLFATHYHELTEISKQYKSVVNYRVDVKEDADKVIFMRKIVEGGADKSYGIHVAKLAGVPNQVIDRAKVILEELENTRQSNSKKGLSKSKPIIQLAFLAESASHPKELNDESLELTKIKNYLSKIDPDSTTPIEALSRLKEIKDMV